VAVLTLHYRLDCPYSLRVRLILAEKALPFSCRVVRSAEPPAELIDISGGEVPVLVDGSLAIADSMVIAEYLEDAFEKPALRPFDPRGRAAVRGAVRRMDRELMGPLDEVMMGGHTPPEKCAASWAKGLAAWEHKVGDNGLLFGMEFSLADVWLVAALEKASEMKWQLDAKLPKVRRWWARVQERACVRSERLG
jgi:glutathione S-transferase